MSAPGPARPSWPATVGLSVAFFWLAIDPQSVGLPNRTIVILAVGSSFALLARFPTTTLRRNPAGALLTACAAWVVVVAPLGLVPVNDIAMAACGLALVLAGHSLAERVDFGRMMTAYVIGLSAAVLLSLLGGQRADNGRVEGLFAGANAFGARGAIIVVLGFASWLSNRHVLNLVPIGLGSLALIASGGRVNLAVASLGVLMVIRTALPRFVPWAWAAAVLALAGATAAGALGQGTVNLVTRAGTGDEIVNLTGRTDVWAATLEGLRSFPLSGIGHAGTPLWYESIAETELGGFNPFEAHNAVLQVALNGGVPAASLLVLAAVSFTVLAWRRPDVIRDTVFVMIVVLGLTEALFRVPNDLWLLLALCMAHVGRGSTRPAPPLGSTAHRAAAAGLEVG